MKQEVRKYVKISEFADVVTGGTPSTMNKAYWENGNIPWIASGECKNSIIMDATKFISEQGYQNSSTKMMPIDTVVIALTGATTGKVGLLGIEACGNQSVTGILPNSNFISKYLFYYLLSIREKVINDSYGGAQKHISQKYVKEIKVPLPPLETQKKIVEVLDKAQGLIDARKEQIRLMDELIKSVFYEMFGDPVTNPKGWEVKKLGEIGSLERGKSKHRPRNAPELLGGEYPLVQTGDIANAGLYIYEYNQTYSELGLQQSKIWDKGTLCVTIAANIAKTSILGFDACFPDSIVAFIPNENVESMYVQIWFGFLQKIIESNAPESAQKNINLKILKDLDIPLPDISIQKRFCDIIDKIEKERKLLSTGMVELENNYESIMQRSFSI